MEPKIVLLELKKLIGIKIEMSFSRDKTMELWQNFMPRRSEVTNRATAEYISMQIYGENENEIFSPSALFEKWAAVEVSKFPVLPSGMESYMLHGGKYAVFIVTTQVV